jgi:hypothetical protein
LAPLEKFASSAIYYFTQLGQLKCHIFAWAFQALSFLRKFRWRQPIRMGAGHPPPAGVGN